MQPDADSRPPTVCALVVTYKRRALLEGLLEALEAQTVRPAEILVLDNLSADGTVEMVRERFPQCRLLVAGCNLGGSGGFQVGLAHAFATGADWIWCMDDDALPHPDALERLLEAIPAVVASAGREPSVLASTVRWTDGQLHRMNIPVPLDLPAPPGLRAMRIASFVSILVNARSMERVGLPLAPYFLWFDDVEFTARLTREGPGFWVEASEVVHRTGTPTMPYDQPTRFHFAVKNRLLMLQSSAVRGERLHWAKSFLYEVKAFLDRQDRTPAAFRVVLKGIAAGIRVAPRPEPVTSPKVLALAAEVS